MAMAESADDRRWRAESDARTMAEAEQIKHDPPRLDAARTAAKRMADEEAERVKGLRKVAGSKGKGTDKQTTGSSDSSKKKISGSSGNTAKHNVFNRI